MNREVGYIPRQSPDEAKRIQELWKKGPEGEKELDALVDSFVAAKKDELINSEDLDERRFQDNARQAKENSDHGKRKIEEFGKNAKENVRRTLALPKVALHNESFSAYMDAISEKPEESQPPRKAKKDLSPAAYEKTQDLDPTQKLSARDLGISDPTIAFFDQGHSNPPKPSKSKKN